MKKFIQSIFICAVIQAFAQVQSFGQNGAVAAQPRPQVVDPYRVINFTTNAITAGWVMFSGTVIDIQTNKAGVRIGVRLEGTFSMIPTGTGETFTGDFFVVNFPYRAVLGDTIGSARACFYAKPAGVYTYPTMFGKVQRIHQLDYGKVWTPPPPTPEQLAQMKANASLAQTAADKKKQIADARALKANLDEAAAGDAYGELRMGERYRDGDGVPKDLAKARDYFSKSAAQGNSTAASELGALPK